MKLVKGQLFESDANIIMVTGNSYLRQDGAVVMGRGAAKQLRDSVPGIDQAFGLAIKSKPNPYGIVSAVMGGRMYGLFQVKHHFKDDAQLDLIQHSVTLLAAYATKYPNVTIAMNFPGIGWGRLSYESVLPLLQSLPDNVSVYQL